VSGTVLRSTFYSLCLKVESNDHTAAKVLAGSILSWLLDHRVYNNCIVFHKQARRMLLFISKATNGPIDVSPNVFELLQKCVHVYLRVKRETKALINYKHYQSKLQYSDEEFSRDTTTAVPEITMEEIEELKMRVDGLPNIESDVSIFNCALYLSLVVPNEARREWCLFLLLHCALEQRDRPCEMSDSIFCSYFPIAQVTEILKRVSNGKLMIRLLDDDRKVLDYEKYFLLVECETDGKFQGQQPSNKTFLNRPSYLNCHPISKPSKEKTCPEERPQWKQSYQKNLLLVNPFAGTYNDPNGIRAATWIDYHGYPMSYPINWLLNHENIVDTNCKSAKN
jgi:hypothetical protein